MEELTRMLNDVNDAYYEFVTAILHYAEKKPSRLEMVKQFLMTHKNASSSDIIKFVSEQPDFTEDIAYEKVG